MPGSSLPSDRCRRLCTVALILPVVAAWCATAAAESTEQFWPELDGYFQLNDRMRISAVVTSTHAEESYRDGNRWYVSDAQLGAHLDISLKTILRTSLLEQD